MTTRPRRHPLTRSGRSRVIALAVVAATATAAAALTFVSGGGRNSASAETERANFVPIEKVAANVVVPPLRRGGSAGVFTVDCGVNENGKFSSDNPVAQPGISNGAEHLHDFVGNLAIDANTSDEALASADTSCTNGDRSSYFWPVVRIDRTASTAKSADPGVASISCPRPADRLPAVPAAATEQVRRNLAELDRQIAQANAGLARGAPGIDADLNNKVLQVLRTQRADTLRRIADAMDRYGPRPTGLRSMVDCEVNYPALHARHGGTRAATGGGPVTLATPTVNCINVRNRLPGVPQPALAEVNRNLDLLDQQIAEANARLVTVRAESGPEFINNAIMGPLRAKRIATLDRIEIAIGRHAARPTGLTNLAGCGLLGVPTTGGNGSQGDNGNQGDNGTGGQPSGEPSPLPEPTGPDLELPGNTGGIVRPADVRIEYRGNATSKVVPMPRFLRALTGDSKPISRGPANARPSWSCSGFADRLSDRYPICPEGSQVLRVHDFPGCWDGQNTDSDNHRSHLAFADPATGACPAGFTAIPQLRITIAYDIPREVQLNGQYALDSFPEENHNPFSDHNDFINVNSERQMTKIAWCINAGRRCR